MTLALAASSGVLGRQLTAQSFTGVLTFSPDCAATSYVCPAVKPKGAAVALNAVDFGGGNKSCGKCVKVTAPKQFAGLYPVSNVMTQGQTGDIDLVNHPLPSSDQCSQRYEVRWQYDAGPCP